MLAWTVLKVWECKWRQGTDSSVEGGCRQPDNDKTAERLDAGRWLNPAWKLVSSINGRQSHPAPSSASAIAAIALGSASILLESAIIMAAPGNCAEERKPRGTCRMEERPVLPIMSIYYSSVGGDLTALSPE